jgi:hypothetical protein
MKKILVQIIFTVLVTVFTSYAQNTPVPGNLEKKFKSSYPDAAAVEWQKSGENYKVTFTDKKNLHHTLLYDKDSKIVSKEAEMDDQAVPKSIREYFVKNFPKEETYRVWKVEDETGKVKYYAPVKDAVIFFDEEGKFDRRDERTPENLEQK